MGKHKEKTKKHKKSKKHQKRERRSSSSSKSSEEEWIEKVQPGSENKETNEKQKREEWMNMSSSIDTISNHDRIIKRENDKKLNREQNLYNPKENPRELNPYWKDGGSGLPIFKKPTDSNIEYKASKSSFNWRKSHLSCSEETNETNKCCKGNVKDDVCKTDLNVLASKLVKAEITGNLELVKELKSKLEEAKKDVANTSKYGEDIILYTDNACGSSRPLKIKSDYKEDSKISRKKQKIETHINRERVRYFADDDKYSLKEMFENEKYESVNEHHKEFLKVVSKAKTDLDDFFVDAISKKDSNSKINKKSLTKAISTHSHLNKTLDLCSHCLQSDTMYKHLMISMGETVYLSIPPFEPMAEGHCFLVPVRHVACATYLDENEWYELLTFRKSLCNMFKSLDKDIIFFETALYIHNQPHMVLHCVPLQKEQCDIAPMYFKKAIDESETEWSINKKLVSLSGKDVRKAIPKGLPYFSVSFGMTEGYAHVIENEKMFPQNFAQEIIGGMLDLDHSKWRKPKKQKFEEQSIRVQNFAKLWSNFDCTK